jgi:hypothetical protein
MAHIAHAVFTVPTLAGAQGEQTIIDVLTTTDGMRSIAVHGPARQVQVDYDATVVAARGMQALLRQKGYPVAGLRLHLRRPAQPTIDRHASRP